MIQHVAQGVPNAAFARMCYTAPRCIHCYNLLELITVYVKKLLEKDKKKTQLDSPFYNNNNTKKMSIKISICIKKMCFLLK